MLVLAGAIRRNHKSRKPSHPWKLLSLDEPPVGYHRGMLDAISCDLEMFALPSNVQRYVVTRGKRELRM